MTTFVAVGGDVYNLDRVIRAEMESGDDPDLWLYTTDTTEILTGEKAQALWAHIRAQAPELTAQVAPTVPTVSEVERWRDAALAIFDLTEGWGRSDVQATPERLYEVRSKLIHLINDLSESC